MGTSSITAQSTAPAPSRTRAMSHEAERLVRIIFHPYDEDGAAWARRLRAPRRPSLSKRHRTSPAAQQRRLDAACAREHDWQEQESDQ